jgi:dTDP-4-amino-4,6-dideoxygalactose transaminase
MSEAAADAAGKTLMSGYVGQGPKVEEFEYAMERELELPHTPLMVSTCTHAIDLALHCCDVGPGDEVISTPITCTATNTPIVRRWAKIVWADVDPRTGLIDPQDVANRITKRTKAIVAVDWGGSLCDYDALKSFDVPVIQDAAHSYLAKPSENRGDYVCWSFQAIKHLTTVEGGLLLTPLLQHKRAKLLRWYGLDREADSSFRCRQTIQEVGYKYSPNDVAASIGLANMEFAGGSVMKARANARFYEASLWEAKKITLPAPDKGSSWWLYTVLSPERDRLQMRLHDAGIESSPVHDRCDKHPEMQNDYPLSGVSEFNNTHLCIPVGWWVTDEDRERIVRVLKDEDKY